jgi:hypothetical protein
MTPAQLQALARAARPTPWDDPDSFPMQAKWIYIDYPDASNREVRAFLCDDLTAVSVTATTGGKVVRWSFYPPMSEVQDALDVGNFGLLRLIPRGARVGVFAACPHH